MKEVREETEKRMAEENSDSEVRVEINTWIHN